MDYKDAKKISAKIKNKIKAQTRASVLEVGSIRRKKSIVRDMDFLICSKNESILSKIKFPNSDIIENGVYRKKLYLHDYGVKIDCFYTTPACRPYALLQYTGSKEFNIRVRAHAKSKGFKLNQYGLYRGDDMPFKFNTERQILEFLGITYKKPEDRIL